MKKITEQQSKLLDDLRKRDKKLHCEWSGELGVFKALQGILDKAQRRQKPETLLRQFVKRFSSLIGTKGTMGQYRVFRNVPAADGGRRISIQYAVNDLVVLSGQIVGYVDQKGVLWKVTSSLPRDVRVSGKATVTEKQLLELLRRLFQSHPEAQEYLEAARSTQPPPSRGRRRAAHPFPLTSRPKKVLRRVGSGYHPTWMGMAIIPADVVSPAGESEWVLTQAEYFVDATDGVLLSAEATIEYADVPVDVQGHAVIRPVSTVVVVHARGVQRDGAKRYLRNVDKDIEIMTYDAGGDEADISGKLTADTLDVSQDADGDWAEWTESCDAATRNDAQQPEIDAHRFATQIYEFYEGLGWKGFDNEGWDGCPVRMITHIGMSSSTAGAGFEKYDNPATGNKHGYVKFYDGRCDAGNLIYDFYAGELGTVAHEYQHAVTFFGVPKSTGDPGGLYSDVIRGAMREGYSDSFAGFIGSVWMLRAPWPTGIAVDGAPLRRIEYPRSNDTFSGEVYCDHYDDIGGGDSKYYKSTTLSHAAFLLAQGGVHDRPGRAPQYIPVPPIGADAASRIWYRALTEKLDGLAAGGGDRRMVDVGDHLLAATEELYGNRSKEYVLVRRALYAVGLFPYNTTVVPYTKRIYGGEACMLPWGWSWRRSQEYLGLPMFRHWQSLDLFVDNGTGIEYDVRIGEENKVYARVRNVGDQPLNDITVEFWYRKIGSALPAAETGWRRCQDADGGNCTLSIASLPAGGMTFEDTYTDANAVEWYLDPDEITDEIDHFCLRAKVLCGAANHDNDYENYVQSNVQHVWADPDSDADSTISFRVGNLDAKKMIPVDIRAEHTLPKGAVLAPMTDLGRIRLKPGEERTISYKLHVPKRAMGQFRPPYDGEIEGELYGELCGPFKGNLVNVKVSSKRQVSGTIAGRTGAIGTITGRLKGHLDVENQTVIGSLVAAFSPIDPRAKKGTRMVGVRAKLRPVRVINFAQMVDGEAIGGVTTHLVVRAK